MLSWKPLTPRYWWKKFIQRLQLFAKEYVGFLNFFPLNSDDRTTSGFQRLWIHACIQSRNSLLCAGWIKNSSGRWNFWESNTQTEEDFIGVLYLLSKALSFLIKLCLMFFDWAREKYAYRVNTRAWCGLLREHLTSAADHEIKAKISKKGWVESRSLWAGFNFWCSIACYLNVLLMSFSV